MKRTISFLLVLLTIFALAACGTPSAPVETQPPHTHSFGDWVITKAATCTEAGEQERYCSCGEKQTQSIAATGHTFGEWITVKTPTCTEAGEQERTCACGEKQTQSVAAKGHTFGDWTTIKEATCTEKGEQERTCVCGEKQTRTIAAKGHTFNAWTTSIEPTCTKTGTRIRKCSNCETIENEPIPATGHNWEEATCTEPKTCTVCYTTEGAALGHNYINGVCARCGANRLPAVVFQNDISDEWPLISVNMNVRRWATSIHLNSLTYEYDKNNNLIISFSANGERQDYCSTFRIEYVLSDAEGNMIYTAVYQKDISLPSGYGNFKLDDEKIKIFSNYIPLELDTIYFKFKMYTNFT